MSSNQIVHRYAKAFYAESQELGLVEKVLEDMITLTDTIDENPILKINLESSGVPQEKKSKVITELFGKTFANETLNLIAFLSSKKRFSYLYQVAKAFAKIYDQEHGKQELKVTLSESLKEDFAQQLAHKIEGETNKKYNLIIHRDTSLKGGFIYQYGDSIFDYSIKGQLSALKTKILSSQ